MEILFPFFFIQIKKNKKIFIDRNHLDELNYSESFSKFLKNKLIKIFIKLIYKHADLVIGISKKLSADLSNFTNTMLKQSIAQPLTNLL